MGIIVFIAVVVALILVHEFGHFLAAKWTGMRVDEFGIGYPPRAATLGKIGETLLTLNWLPFGGFVKIFGEDPAPGVAAQTPDARAFSKRPRFAQAFVLAAGVAMNLLFAYALLSAALAIGTPRALSPHEAASASALALAVADVLPGSPAALAGLMPGDEITGAADRAGVWHAQDPSSFSSFIAASRGEPVTLSLARAGKPLSLTLAPSRGLVESDPARYALGVEVATVGIAPLPLPRALSEGARLTYATTLLTAQALLNLFLGIFTLHADLASVAGPIGIAGAVGNASAEGLGALLALVAVISINLALINLVPVPALDGGRLLFVLIESVTRRPIAPKIAQALNAAGFTFLILLMAVVTAHDLFKLIG